MIDSSWHLFSGTDFMSGCLQPVLPFHLNAPPAVRLRMAAGLTSFCRQAAPERNREPIMHKVAGTGKALINQR
jgi:hypothetical protein